MFEPMAMKEQMRRLKVTTKIEFDQKYTQGINQGTESMIGMAGRPQDPAVKESLTAENLKEALLLLGKCHSAREIKELADYIDETNALRAEVEELRKYKENRMTEDLRRQYAEELKELRDYDANRMAKVPFAVEEQKKYLSRTVEYKFSSPESAMKFDFLGGRILLGALTQTNGDDVVKEHEELLALRKFEQEQKKLWSANNKLLEDTVYHIITAFPADPSKIGFMDHKQTKNIVARLKAAIVSIPEDEK